MVPPYGQLAKQTILLQQEYGLKLDEFLTTQVEMYKKFYGKHYFDEIRFRNAVLDERTRAKKVKAGAV